MVARSVLRWAIDAKAKGSYIGDVQFWEQDENYMKLFEGVKNFEIVNDPRSIG